MKRIFLALRNAVIGFIVGVITFTALQVVWWRFAPYPTATILTPIEVLNPHNEVKRGGQLDLFLIIDKQSDYSPEVSRNVLCGDRIYFVPANALGGTARPQGKFTAEVSFTMPDYIPLNTPCTFIFHNEYNINPIRTINKSWGSEPFMVIK